MTPLQRGTFTAMLLTIIVSVVCGVSLAVLYLLGVKAMR